jgi:branched-chain amino acid transport system permease protein
LELALEILPQVLLDGLVLGFMYALIALGYTMVYGVLEFINFAHSEIFVLGAFVGVEVLFWLQEAGHLAVLHPAFVLSLVIAAGMLISGLAAMALERIAYRPTIQVSMCSISSCHWQPISPFQSSPSWSLSPRC